MTTTRRLAVQRELYRRSYAAFFRASWQVHEPTTALAWNWHHDVFCAHLQAVVDDWRRRQHDATYVQRIRNLLCTFPAGTLKSRFLTALVPWIWIDTPGLRAIALSCNPRVSGRDSRIARTLIGDTPSDWYQATFRPTWRIRTDVDNVGVFENTAGGWRAAQSFEQKAVGQRGDLIIVDDPHDPEEADSDAQRQHVHDRWDGAIADRVNDLSTSIRIAACHRTHEFDWSSARIEEGWAHLFMPVLFEAERICETPLGRPDRRTIEGDNLHPERFTSEVIKEEKAKPNGERRWATIYQGRPSPAGGTIVPTDSLRFFRRWDQSDAASTRPKGCWTGPSAVLPSSFDRVAIGADLAGGKKTAKGDYNVIAAVARKDASFYVLEVWRARADFPEVQRAFRAMSARYPSAGKYVEQQAAGAPLVTSLQAEIPGIVAIPSTTGKVERIESVLGLFQAGNVHLDDHAPVRDYAIHEITSVPASRYDDLTDAIVIALIQLAQTPTRNWNAEARFNTQCAANTLADYYGRPRPFPYKPKPRATQPTPPRPPRTNISKWEQAFRGRKAGQ